MAYCFHNRFWIAFTGIQLVLKVNTLGFSDECSQHIVVFSKEYIFSHLAEYLFLSYLDFTTLKVIYDSLSACSQMYNVTECCHCNSYNTTSSLKLYTQYFKCTWQVFPTPLPPYWQQSLGNASLNCSTQKTVMMDELQVHTNSFTILLMSL